MTTFQPASLVKHLIIVLAVFVLGSIPGLSQMDISINVAPPPLPMYEQPACPSDGYLWAPGYWAYGDYGYYWVPGTWVLPPQAGLLWTPCYWGWGDSGYAFFPGYWGTNIGFYGGVNYGYGYGGNGYGGGRWQDGRFFYNTAVNNVASVSIHDRYSDATFSRNAGSVSFNGGDGGIQARPTAQEQQYASERHVPATTAQVAHVHAASVDRGQLAVINGGRPTTVAVATAKSYKSISLQHAKAQPLTKATALKEQQPNSAKSGAGISPNPQPDMEKQVSPVSRYTPPAESRDTLTPPNDRSAAPNPEPERALPRPEAEAKPQPQMEAKPQPQAEAKPQPQAEAKSQPRPEAPAQSQSNKPQSN
jgi:hypothetical protein